MAEFGSTRVFPNALPPGCILSVDLISESENICLCVCVRDVSVRSLAAVESDN